MFKHLSYVNDQLYEVEFLKSEIEHREPIIVWVFILQYAKLRMLELYFNFFDKYCNVTKFEDLEMDTDSLYLALSERELYAYVRPALKQEWDSLRCGDSTVDFIANSTTIFFLELDALSIRNAINENLVSLKKNSSAQELFLCSKTYYSFDFQSNTF